MLFFCIPAFMLIENLSRSRNLSIKSCESKRHLFLVQRPRRLKGTGDLVTRMTLCRWLVSFGRLRDKGLSVRMQIIFRNDSKLQYLLCGSIGRWMEQCPPICVFENKLGHFFPLTDRKLRNFLVWNMCFEFDLKLWYAQSYRHHINESGI